MIIKVTCYISKIPTDFEEIDEYADLLIKYEKNTFWISISSPKDLIGFVNGKFGKNRKMIEDMTGATVLMPGRNQEEIVIKGQSKNSVGSAYRRIAETIKSGRFHQDFTHFISIPINAKEVQESFLRFKDDVLRNFKKVRGIDESLFQEPKKMHLTITTLVLLDNRDKLKAEAIFQKCKNEIVNFLDGKTLEVNVKGIEYMNDDPAEVDVLYAKVEEVDDDSCLQIVANMLMNSFTDNDLSKKQYDQVKLHITLMNTSFRSKGAADESRQRITFDARPILEKYEDYDFGQMVLSEVHISIRYSTGADGYYMPNNKISLN
ncbi:activating signal cointegrator 1 complex subunit 1-like isoform X2 [Uloborus diversus]|uniref:activating signal cointegrator 1 complex subunit 1-like isoform X2 n=1 Tax=Uloborus diversus TaxID=327109 RepID=UPI00240A19DC|nr:activating signal cointegrator 1 complex subunit 1-like isoform X2 [Uloborus diversus]